MKSEINVKDYYNHFINSADDYLKAYSEELNENKVLLDEYINRLKFDIDNIKNKLNINLYYYIDFVQPLQSDVDKLLGICVKLLPVYDKDEDVNILNYIIKFCKIVTNINWLNKAISMCNIRKEITYTKYRELIKLYYDKAVDELFKGKGVRCDNGLGVIIIEYIPQKENNFKKVDMAATAKRKQELLNKGIKLYNAEEAKEYERAGIKYDGVNCVVYSENQFLLYPLLLNAVGFEGNVLRFYPANYVAKELRGFTTQELADNFTDEQLSKKRLYLITRVNVELKRHPEYWTKYVHKMKNI